MYQGYEDCNETYGWAWYQERYYEMLYSEFYGLEFYRPTVEWVYWNGNLNVHRVAKVG